MLYFTIMYVASTEIQIAQDCIIIQFRTLSVYKVKVVNVVWTEYLIFLYSLLFSMSLWHESVEVRERERERVGIFPIDVN
jgi:hypothetical protein